MALNPVPTYDCLFIGDALEKRFGGFAIAELHLFAYLACLLSVYSHRPAVDWGYGFVSTEIGAPFSREIELTVAELIRLGLFFELDERTVLTQAARDEFHFLSNTQLL